VIIACLQNRRCVVAPLAARCAASPIGLVQDGPGRTYHRRHTPGWLIGLLSIAWLCGGGGLAPLPADDLVTETCQAYRVGELWTGDGQRIRDAVLVVRDGKIQSVGVYRQMDLPSDCPVHDFSSLVMMPGMIVAETGLAESGADDELAVSPEVQAVDGFDFFEPRHTLLAAGVTTVQLAPGTARLLPGQGSVVKLAGDSIDERVLRRSESMRILLTQAALNPPTIYEPPVGAVSELRPLLPTRPQLAGTLSGAINGLMALLTAAQDTAAQDTAAQDTAERSAKDQDSELPVRLLAEALQQGQTFRLTARSGPEVQAALDLARRYQLKVLVVQPRASAALEQLDWSDPQWQGVILSPGVRPGRLEGVWGNQAEDEESARATAWELAAALVAAGAEAKLAFRVEVDQDLVHVRYLAALLQQGGLSAEQVVRILTDNPARLLGIADRVGRLAPGLDADFVLLNGGPLAMGSRVEATYVNGREVYRADLAAETRVVSAGHVYVDGHLIPQARVAVRGGKISGVGTQVSAPVSAAHDHFPEAVIVPGFVDLGTAVGWGAAVTDRLPLQTKMGDYLAVDDDTILAARRGGITVGLLSSSSLPSPVVAFKLGDRPRVLRDPVALRFEVKGNLTQVENSLRRTLQSGKAYHEAWVKYEAEFADYQSKLKQYEADLAKYEAEKKAREAAAAEPSADPQNPGSPAAAPPAGGGEAAGSGNAVRGGGGSRASASGGGESRPTAGPRGPTGPPRSVNTEPMSAGKVDSNAAATSPQSPASADPPATDQPTPPTKPTEPQKPRVQEALEPYRPLIRREIPAIVEVVDPLSTRLALKLFRTEFQLSTVLAGGEGLEQVAAEVAQAGAKFVTGPELFSQADDMTVNFPQVLAQHQIAFGFQSKSAASSAGLPYLVGFAVHQGLANHDALQALTQSAAEIFQLPQLGRVAVGYDADLVVLSGPPFDPGSQVLAVMIDGQWVYRRGTKP
jgi:imidazolonepropionase-like amidohydrolase